MDQSLKLLVVYDSQNNQYTISDHNLEEQHATQLVEQWQPHLRSGCSFIALDQKRRHRTADAQTCRACRDQVKESSGRQPVPRFKKKQEFTASALGTSNPHCSPK